MVGRAWWNERQHAADRDFLRSEPLPLFPALFNDLHRFEDNKPVFNLFADSNPRILITEHRSIDLG
jgi:hypothetical protein